MSCPSVTVQVPAPIVVTVSQAGTQGPPGPQGPAGASASTYTHTQSTPLATWVVSHNLGFVPAVSVASPGGLEIETEVAHLSVNLTEIRFNTPTTGTARFV